MIEDYKEFLKENKEFFYMMLSAGTLTIFFIFIMIGSIAVVSKIERTIDNNRRLNTYRENLAIFQKCAEKIEDPSLIETYCGNAPNEPVVIW